MTDAELDAIRERARETAERYENADWRLSPAERDCAALLSHVYELTKQRAIDAEEMRRLTLERDSAREALRVSEAHVRELSGRQFVVYRNCDKHLSIPWTTLAVPTEGVWRAVCPHCEPPK